MSEFERYMTHLNFEDEDVVYFSSNTTKQKDKSRAKFARVRIIAKNWSDIKKKLTQKLEKEDSQEAYALLISAKTGIRIGNEFSAEGYVSKVKKIEGQFIQTYGLSTLLKKHVSFQDDKMILDFLGKKAVEQYMEVTDPMLVEYGKKFYKANEGEKFLNIDKLEISRFIRTNINQVLTIKDFRTFCANCEAFKIYKKYIEGTPIPETKSSLSKEIKLILEKVSDKLHNTPGICKSAYISPIFIDYVTSQRNSLIVVKEQERAKKKIEKEEAWKKMNEDRIAQGLKPLRKKRRIKKKKVEVENEKDSTE